MNNTLDNSLDANLKTNFNTAMKMSSGNFCYEELIAFLNSDAIVEKQLAVLELNEIKSTEDAELLVSNLVGQDGKIREAVAYKVNELINIADFKPYFLTQKNYEIFLKAIMDINGNVCRQIVDLITLKEFNDYLCEHLPTQIAQTWEEIQKIDFLDAPQKKYVVSKRNFQLYWEFEALYNLAEKIDFNTIKQILLDCGEFYDYTIREKIAKILTKIDNNSLNDLKEKLKNDENYYVRRYLHETDSAQSAERQGSI